MLRASARRLGGAGQPSAGTRFVAKIFNTTPRRIAEHAGDVTALGPLTVVVATGAIVCVGYMSRTLFMHPDVYLGERFGRADTIRDNQKKAERNYEHLLRRTFQRHQSEEGAEFHMMVFPSMNAAAGKSPHLDPDMLYKRALTEAKKLDEEFPRSSPASSGGAKKKKSKKEGSAKKAKKDADHE